MMSHNMRILPYLSPCYGVLAARFSNLTKFECSHGRDAAIYTHDIFHNKCKRTHHATRKFQIYTLKLNAISWLCKKMSDYFWTRVYSFITTFMCMETVHEMISKNDFKEVPLCQWWNASLMMSMHTFMNTGVRSEILILCVGLLNCWQTLRSRDGNRIVLGYCKSLFITFFRGGGWWYWWI